jgi:hypothetical protein
MERKVQEERMAQTSNDYRESFRGSKIGRGFPWVFAGLVLAVLMAVGYSIDSDRSLSEREGVVTQTDAENDVIPSLPPEKD